MQYVEMRILQLKTSTRSKERKPMTLPVLSDETTEILPPARPQKAPAYAQRGRDLLFSLIALPLGSRRDGFLTMFQECH
jgi:hypothetical protein